MLLIGILLSLPIVIASGFVSVNGTHFYLDGEPFYFAGGNAYFLWYGYYNCNSTSPANQGLCTPEALDDAVGLNFTVIRTWGFSDGLQFWGSLQNPNGTYPEASFQKFDRLIKEAGDRDLKLIISLTNNWDDYGGMCQYAKWCGVPNANICNPNSGQPGTPAHDAFYTNACTKDLYERYVTFFLNRTNTLTGVKYKDDPIIMAWELANEPRAMTDPTGQTLRNWIAEMSAYIKSLDSNHLVTTGEDGFYISGSRPEYGYHAEDGADYILNSDIPTIDFASFHAYDWWGSQSNLYYWIQKHGEDARFIFGKPTVAGEIDASKSDSYIQDVYNQMEVSRINGDLIWMICPTGFSESGGRCIKYPEDTLVPIAQSHSAYMDSYVPPANHAPVLAHIDDVTVNATGLVTIVADAADQDGDPLNYSIDNPWFVKNGNVFTWQTSLYSTGYYNFRMTVNDGDLGDSQIFYVNVTGQNFNCTLPQNNLLITKDTTLCPGNYNLPDGITISASGVTLTCENTFLIGGGSSTGIRVSPDSKNNVTIKNCRVEEYTNCILYQYHHRYGKFINNTLINCGYGIDAREGTIGNNVFIGNRFINSTLYLHNVDYSVVENNTFSRGDKYANDIGIQLHKADYGVFINNSISGYNQGIVFDGNSYNLFEDNIFMENLAAASFFWGGWHNVFMGNRFVNNTYGLKHDASWYGQLTNISIIGNEFVGNNYGLYLGAVANSEVVSNNLIDNVYGIKVLSGVYLSRGNTFYRNNLIKSSISYAYNANDGGTNDSWSYNSQGNYWSSYDTPAEGCNDANSDRICDLPYAISGGNNSDNYPFTEKNGWLPPEISISPGWNLFTPLRIPIDAKDKNISLRQGWNLFGYSGLQPFDWSEAVIWDGSENSIYDGLIQSSIYYYDNGAYSLVPGDDAYLQRGKAYWLYAYQDNLILILPNAGGSSMGSSHTWAAVEISDGSTTKNVADAESVGWLQSTLYYYDDGYKLVPDDNESVYPWRGYWIFSNKNLTLIIQ